MPPGALEAEAFAGDLHRELESSETWDDVGGRGRGRVAACVGVGIFSPCGCGVHKFKT